MKVQRTQDVQAPVQKKHKSKTGKKRHGRGFFLVRTLLIALLLSATLVYGALSPFFNIERISVKETAKHYTDQALVESSGILPGINGFRLLFHNPGKFYFFRVGSAEKAILEKCPYIESAKVRYVLPASISIQVSEREPSMILTADGTNLLVDREAYLLEVDPDMKKIKLPEIRIKRPKELKPGKKLLLTGNEIETARKVYDGIRDMDSQYQDKLLPEVDYVDVSDPEKPGFSLQSRIRVNLGSLDDLMYKLNAVKTVFSKNMKKSEKGKLEFTSEGNPIFTPESGR